MELCELISSIDIVEYISQFIELEEKNGEYWGLSPFTDEKTPSFSIRADPPYWYDFSSGKSGNLFTFIKEYNHFSNKEVIEEIKRYAGYDGNITSEHEQVSILEVCKKYRAKQKESRPQIISELPDNYMERFENRKDKLKVWEDAGISSYVLDKFQVRYDGLTDSIVYPIRNANGKIVNIGARTLDPDWKEKKIRKYTYRYKWGSMRLLYGLYEALDSIHKNKSIIVFEGVKSVLIAHTWGVKNAVALLTSHLNMWQMRILIRLGYRVVFALDKDVCIREDKNIQILKGYVDCEYIWDRENLLDEKDSPVDKGSEIFIKLYNSRLLYR